MNSGRPLQGDIPLYYIMDHTFFLRNIALLSACMAGLTASLSGQSGIFRADTFLLSQRPIPAGTYQARRIAATGTVQDLLVRLEAKESAELLPGFLTNTGANFEAFANPALVLDTTPGSGTDHERAVYVKTAYHNGKVMVRWAPADYSVWLRGVRYGYRVVRQPIAANGQTLTQAQITAATGTFGPFRPLPEADWVGLRTDTSEIAATAAGAIYNKEFEPVATGGPIGQILSTTETAENRFAFGLFAADQSFEVAGWMGLALTDLPPAAHTQYLYTVIINEPVPAGQRPGGGANTADMAQPLVLPPLPAVKATTGASVVTLTMPRGNLDEHYTSYIMERSADNGTTFQRRNRNALVFLDNGTQKADLIFIDTLENDTVYQYRMRGKSIFGANGPVTPLVSARAVPPPLDARPEFIDIKEVNSHLVLSWNFPAELNTKIKGFKIYRSIDATGEFVLVPGGDLSVVARSFTLVQHNPLLNYYKIVAIDLNDNVLSSIVLLGQLNDTTPPAAPQGLRGEITPDGLVTLRWRPGREVDLKGYRVFFSNVPNGDFSQLTGTVIADSVFTHQLNTAVLNTSAYYKILATDFRENNSPYTATLTVRRPDRVPPVPPVLTHVDPMANGVTLKWVRSSSPDVARHELQRKPNPDIDWQIIRTYQPGTPADTLLIDSTQTGIFDYNYRVVAYDSTGLTGISTVVTVKPVNVQAPAATNFTVELTGDQPRKAKLNWTYTSSALVDKFQIFRAVDTVPAHLYYTLPANRDKNTVDPATQNTLYSWRDADIRAGRRYRYYIITKMADGSGSKPSAIVEFRF